MGRQLQEAMGQEPQVVIMTPLLEGTDGVKKMSKSLGNYIGINEPPQEIFGKVMSISDDLMYRYYEILTECNLEEIKTLHPKEAKMRLGEEIVCQFHPGEEALKARQSFERIFSEGQNPEDTIDYKLSKTGQDKLVDILLGTKLVASKNEFRRLLGQGAVSFEGQKIADEDWTPKPGIVKVGKRRFVRLI